MKINLKQALVIGVTGLFGLGAGIMISAATGLFGVGAQAEVLEVHQEAKIDHLKEASDEVKDAYRKAGLVPGETQTNALGQTFSTELGTDFPDSVPDLIAVWVDSTTIGFIPKEDLFPKEFGIGGRASNSSAEGYYTAYESDGVTVITKELRLSDEQ